jgi:DNA-binding beta-propeller fold protein YncE
MKTTSLLLSAIALCFVLSAQGQEKPALTLSKTIPLPGIQGGFNHMSADAEQHRLFATATANKTLEIIDMKSGKPWRSLEGERPAAAMFAPEFNQLYVTRGPKVCIYDGSTFELLTNVDLQCGLDELGYNTAAKRLYVGCMTSNNTAIAILSLPDGKQVGKIKLPAKPQGFAVEQKGTRIFVNLPSLKQIAVLDGEKQKLIDTWPLKDPAANYPMALDEANHRLFVGCRQPAQLAVFDTTTGKPVASVAISGDTDDLAYDAAHQRVYIACGEGSLDVIEQHDADHYQLRERISTLAGARNGCFTPGANEFYLAIPQRSGQDAAIRVYQPQ